MRRKAPVRGQVSRAALRSAAVVLALAAWPVAAQQFSFSSIRVEGNARIPTGTILTQAGIGSGQALGAGALNDAAQRIRQTGLFESVDVVPQGSTLVIRVVEYPTITRIAFEGNRSKKDAELAALVQSLPRHVFNPATAEADVAAITAAYAESGRVNAVVTPAIIRHNDNRVDLVFQIAEGGVSEVERITFVGNRSFGNYRLRNVLETRQAGLLRAIISRDTFSPDRINADRQMLTDFYRSRGFADFTVQNIDVELTQDRGGYLVTYNIQEGQRFTFGNVGVTSDLPEVDAAAFRQVVHLRSGERYSPVKIEQDIARIERLATRLGLNFVRVEPRITRNDRDLQLNVEFALVRGDRIFVERIDIEGNATTQDRVIRNQFTTVEGDPFNPREIRESAERIRALGYFANADVNARQGSAPDQVVIDVDVVEQPTGSLSFGANFSSDNGVSLLASFAERNFMGRGQTLNFDLSTGQQNRVLSFNFAEPNFLGRDLRFGVALEYRTTDSDYALYDTETFRFSPSLAFPVSENGRLSVYYAVDFGDIKDVDLAASDIIQNEALAGGIWTQSVGYTYTWDTRRTGIDPNTGFVLRFGQEFGVGDASFVKTTALASAETRVWGENVTLRATLEGGLLDYNEGSSRVTDRFFMGSRVMRGFEPGGIGPRDAATDDALGGNAYAVLRLESEFPLGLPEEYGITGGAFIDYGSLWNVGETGGVSVLYNDFTPRTIAGVSLFWKTPIGPLRFNFTTPLDVQDEDRPRSFDLTIATSF
ncbi:MAG: outer membrane protein assembly factor BamA [Rubellimicrobium sp.]|nr:outer membrane protein assembly factor BamA [Rubellimicrobium sp.]